jgi:hypothetical protein
MAKQRRPVPGPVEPAHPALLRQFRDGQEWLSRRENLEKYPGQVVAVGASVVWGHGPDHGTAVRLAEKALAESSDPGKPAPEDLVYIFVPDLVTPEDPLPPF